MMALPLVFLILLLMMKLSLPNAGAAETRRAIEAAEAAFASWRQVVAKERSVILKRWFSLIMANQEDLAALMTAEQGKPLAESRGEVAYGAAFVLSGSLRRAAASMATPSVPTTPTSASSPSSSRSAWSLRLRPGTFLSQ